MAILIMTEILIVRSAIAGRNFPISLSALKGAFRGPVRVMAGAHHDESKDLVRGLHAMHGLRLGTVRIAGPGGFGNRGDSHQGRGIQPAADGESPAGLFAVIEEIGLIAGRISGSTCSVAV